MSGLSKLQSPARKFRAISAKNLLDIPQVQNLDDEIKKSLLAVTSVFPFRVNQYVIDELIDWEQAPADPIYQLSFPQPDMLSQHDIEQLIPLVLKKDKKEELQQAAASIRQRMNPHPAGQMTLNVPQYDGQSLDGIQHKYTQTVLLFPKQGQTCHTYCTYCFRWAQFVGDQDLQFATRETAQQASYVAQHPEITDLLITGGDPMVMSATNLRRFIAPFLNIPHVSNIRIGTKSLAWWPYRFVSDKDADEVLQLFEEIQKAGKHLALMAHSSHPRELSTPIAKYAFERIRNTGTVIRCQAPLIKHVNDDSRTWAELWRKQVQLGAIPYYMFVERDTGPKDYFGVPLVRAFEIFQKAYRDVSGLARTVRGPSMSCTPGKIMVDGITTINGAKVMVLKVIQGRDANWAGKIFFAKYDEKATWIDQLKSINNEPFFFEKSLPQIPCSEVLTSEPTFSLPILDHEKWNKSQVSRP